MEENSRKRILSHENCRNKLQNSSFVFDIYPLCVWISDKTILVFDNFITFQCLDICRNTLSRVWFITPQCFDTPFCV